jgi:4-amino-4-deoxychorismate lyase
MTSPAPAPAPAADSDFSIFTSLRYDPLLLSCPANTVASSLGAATPFYLLSHHRDRMLAAAEHFSYPAAATSVLRDLGAFTQRLEEAIDESAHGREGPLKVHRLHREEGRERRAGGTATDR